MLSRAFTISALVSIAAALGFSDQCNSALTGIAANPDAAACLAPNALISVFLGSSNTSIVDPINKWLTGLCGSPLCSNDTLAAIVTNATTGCATELSAVGFNAAEEGAKEQITLAVQLYYPTVQKVVCLTDGGQNCITQTLKNLESVIGPLSVENVVKVAAGGFPITSIPKNFTCTNCLKEAYNIVKQDFSAEGVFATQEDNQVIQEQCGADFTDGKTPAGISQANVTNKDVKQESGSVSFTTPFMGVSALVVISSVFAVLA